MSFPYPQPIPDDIADKTKAEHVLTVAEYIQYLNTTLRPDVVTIQGEVGQITDRGSAAIYFNLCDKTEKAVINCLIWRNRLTSSGVELKEGMEVKIQGYAEMYAPSGRLSIMTQYIIPVGEGALQLAFEKLKKELEQAGYFRQDRKRTLPQFVQRIGLITSETAAAKKDFLTHVGNHGYKVYFYDVRVEGIKAVENIVAAIRWFNEHRDDIELLVITRGGGSLERLQAFNTVEVARAMYGSRIPVMTAIGHEQDVTIADLVADIRASVPTHAGKLVGEPWELAAARIETIEGNIIAHFRSSLRNIEKRIDGIEANMLVHFRRKLRDFETRLTYYQDTFFHCFSKHVKQCFKDLERYNRSMMGCFKDMLQAIKRIERDFSYNYERFTHKIASVRKTIAFSEKGIEKDAQNWYVGLVRKVADHEKMLLLSDPQRKLKQGFSIVKDKTGKVIKSSKQVNVDDIIAIQLYEGTVDTKVKSTY
jgi:exodeoxyribonuclease VII large subunit